MEGKLPHIVETNHFDPDLVKEQVKEMLRWRNDQADFVHKAGHE